MIPDVFYLDGTLVPVKVENDVGVVVERDHYVEIEKDLKVENGEYYVFGVPMNIHGRSKVRDK